MSQFKSSLSLQPLFCKSLVNNSTAPTLFQTYAGELNASITFRSLDLNSDLDFLFDWVNQSYSRRFWQLNGSKQLLEDTYTVLLNNPHAHSFIGLLEGQPVAQMDMYQVAADELVRHIDASPDDCGIHLLMLPPQYSKKHLSRAALKAFVSFYFSSSPAGDLYAEPDHENILANRLAGEVGFSLLKKINLSNKTANLYRITREQYFSLHS